MIIHAVCVLGLSLGAVSLIQTERPAPIGIVDYVSGRWTRAQDRRTVLQGELVFAQHTFLADRSVGPSLIIQLLDTGEPLTRTCSTSAPCDGSYRPAAALANRRPSGFWTFLTSFWTPTRELDPIVLGSRSASSAGPAHAVIADVGGHADLGAALTSLADGQYTVRLIPAPDIAQEVESRTAAIRVGVPGGTVVSDLARGLYVLTVSRSSGEPVGSNALLLVSAAADEALLQQWNEAQAKVKEWPGVNPRTAESVLARVLYALAATSLK